MSSQSQQLTVDYILSRCFEKTPESVKVLNLWGSHIVDISILSKFPSLEILSLSENEIQDIKALSFLRNLHELYLQNNKISDFNQIEYLKENKNLTKLVLLDNPITYHEDYPQKIIDILPQLKQLDEKEIKYVTGNNNNNQEGLNSPTIKLKKKISEMRSPGGGGTNMERKNMDLGGGISFGTPSSNLDAPEPEMGMGNLNINEIKNNNDDDLKNLNNLNNNNGLFNGQDKVGNSNSNNIGNNNRSESPSSNNIHDNNLNNNNSNISEDKNNEFITKSFKKKKTEGQFSRVKKPFNLKGISNTSSKVNVNTSFTENNVINENNINNINNNGNINNINNNINNEINNKTFTKNFSLANYRYSDVDTNINNINNNNNPNTINLNNPKTEMIYTKTLRGNNRRNKDDSALQALSLSFCGNSNNNSGGNENNPTFIKNKYSRKIIGNFKNLHQHKVNQSTYVKFQQFDNEEEEEKRKDENKENVTNKSLYQMYNKQVPLLGINLTEKKTMSYIKKEIDKDKEKINTINLNNNFNLLENKEKNKESDNNVVKSIKLLMSALSIDSLIELQNEVNKMMLNIKE